MKKRMRGTFAMCLNCTRRPVSETDHPFCSRACQEAFDRLVADKSPGYDE